MLRRCYIDVVDCFSGFPYNVDIKAALHKDCPMALRAILVQCCLNMKARKML